MSPFFFPEHSEPETLGQAGHQAGRRRGAAEAAGGEQGQEGPGALRRGQERQDEERVRSEEGKQVRSTIC